MASPRIPQYYVILYYIMLYYIVRRNARGSSSIFSKVENFLLGLALAFFPTPIIIICERGLRINIWREDILKIFYADKIGIIKKCDLSHKMLINVGTTWV